MNSEPISVIKVGAVLLATMPADPDDATVSAVQERTLNAMEQHNVRGLVLDLSRVEIRTLPEPLQKPPRWLV